MMNMYGLLHTFLRDVRGNVAIAGALCLTVLIVLVVGQIQVTDALMRQTRLHQAQTAGIVAVAKEGEDTEAAEREALLSAYMKQNLAALNKQGDVVTHTVSSTKDTNSVISSFIGRYPFMDILGGAFSATLENTVRAERFYSPIEAVLVLDGSSSMMGYSDLMHNIVERVTNRLFRGEETADDVRVTLLSYQYHVNIGRKYADKLFTPESRKLYQGTTSTELTAYAKRKATLDEYHPNLANDLLQEGSNTLGDIWDMACPSRMPLASASDVPDYIANLEVPPASPEDGFTLLMGDGRPILEYTGTTQSGLKTQSANLTKAISATVLTSIAMYWRASNYNGRDIREVVAIPAAIYDANPSGRTDQTFRTWKSSDNKALSSDYSDIVSISFECPSMPMLVGSNSRAEILERGTMWGSGLYTGGDEGIAWAIRALSPNWSDIWEVEENYPAPYHSVTEKRILYFGGKLTRGFPDIYDSPDAVTPMCDKMREDGVDIYILLGNELLGDSEAIYNACNPKFLQRMAASSTDEDLPELLEGMATRQYRVRLTQ